MTWNVFRFNFMRAAPTPQQNIRRSWNKWYRFLLLLFMVHLASTMKLKYGNLNRLLVQLMLVHTPHATRTHIHLYANENGHVFVYFRNYTDCHIHLPFAIRQASKLWALWMGVHRFMSTFIVIGFMKATGTTAMQSSNIETERMHLTEWNYTKF